MAAISQGMKAAMDAEVNPFRLPDKDQIILHREQEWQRRKEERERVKQLRVWEKTTASSEVRRTRRIDDGSDDVMMDDTGPKTARYHRSESLGIPRDSGPKSARSARTESVGRDPSRREKPTGREKENVAEFVKKKRDMFLVQMSLDVKQAEILKLFEKTKQKEEALKKSQAMLDEDNARFDAFLKSNDDKAHKAMQDAENMTKMKQDRLARIKFLKSQLSAVQAEMIKFKEQKDECVTYKRFLVEKLTPVEWKQQKEEEKRERRVARKREEVELTMQEIQRRMNAEIDAEVQAMEEKRPEKMKAEQIRERERELEQRKKRIKRKYPTREQVENETAEVSSGEEIPLFFEEPRQLLEIFTALEENNLFLIQNSQNTEQSLEELQQKFAELKTTSGAKTSKMKQNIAHLERQIADERAKCEEMRSKLSQKRGVSEQEGLLQEVAQQVLEVHAASGQTIDHDPNTLQMLGVIEAKLEDYLADLDAAEETEAGANMVRELERRKDRRRRQKIMMKKKQREEARKEERVRISQERAEAPIYKKIGKQIMFRSSPLQQARRIVQEDDGLEEALREHEVFGIWINKAGVPEATLPHRPA
eukprot:TRINITY_DN44217_c0_g1_i1.p1 TRINITY_DN44217_c0_g1~~TRINITY_DN44217_c0_g1_i1.p1  ORF type:complete len:593 (+),score=154.11 TRINITY_DN44217_c0_g1_i1:106-1884(+)